MENNELNNETLKAMFKDIADRFKETDKKFKETDKKFKETSEQFKETDKKFQATDKKFNKLQGLFTTQWGKLIEAIVAPACLNLFVNRGIDVSDTQRNRIIKINGQKKAEYDVVLANGEEVVIVEVKTTLKVEHVNYFLEKLSEVKTWIKSYADKKIYGAVAAISFDENSDEYAEKNGLFVIKNSGEGILSINNLNDFSPRAF